MMNDFETARKLACQVEDPAGPSLPCGECAGCLALDHIEAEVEQMRDALTSANDDYADSKAEVERLTKEKEDLRKAYEVVWDNSAEDRAEVERLRGTEAWSAYRAAEKLLRERDTEVERLTAIIEGSAPTSPIGVQRAIVRENERLRARLVSAETYRDAARDEAQRLRMQLSTAKGIGSYDYDYAKKMEREVERLRPYEEMVKDFWVYIDGAPILDARP